MFLHASQVLWGIYQYQIWECTTHVVFCDLLRCLFHGNHCTSTTVNGLTKGQGQYCTSERTQSTTVNALIKGQDQHLFLHASQVLSGSYQYQIWECTTHVVFCDLLICLFHGNHCTSTTVNGLIKGQGPYCTSERTPTYTHAHTLSRMFSQ